MSRGTAEYKVRALCGDPAQEVQYREFRVHGRQGQLLGSTTQLCGDFVSRAREIVTDEWVYDFGPRKLTQLLVFRQGHLHTVHTGSYGVERAESSSDDE